MSVRSCLRRTEDNRNSAEFESSAAPIIAARAAGSKKAIDVRILDLRGISSFTDFFVICSGANTRQIQAIMDEVEAQLKKEGERPIGIEGYDKAEWILADYGDFIVNVFSQPARAFYDIERLWRQAKEINFSEPEPAKHS
jgi:ribosome-associated protein